LIPAVASFESAREFLFRTVAQFTVSYQSGPLSTGKAGRVHGGDRLPWAGGEGLGNFAALAAMRWQVHVYGSASAELGAWCAAQGAPLHTFEWRPEHETAGLTRDAVYLLRPDSYVALLDPSGSPEVLQLYADERRMKLAVS
jgi:hypothetical protein